MDKNMDTLENKAPFYPFISPFSIKTNSNTNKNENLNINQLLNLQKKEELLQKKWENFLLNLAIPCLFKEIKK